MEQVPKELVIKLTRIMDDLERQHWTLGGMAEDLRGLAARTGNDRIGEAAALVAAAARHAEGGRWGMASGSAARALGVLQQPDPPPVQELASEEEAPAPVGEAVEPVPEAPVPQAPAWPPVVQVVVPPTIER